MLYNVSISIVIGSWLVLIGDILFKRFIGFGKNEDLTQMIIEELSDIQSYQNKKEGYFKFSTLLNIFYVSSTNFF